MSMKTMRVLLAVLCVGTAAHAQVSVSPASVTMYPSASTNVAVTIAGGVTVTSVNADAGLTATPGTFGASGTLTITSGAGATGSLTVTLVPSTGNNTIIPVTIRARPTFTDNLALASGHGTHLHSGPGAVQTSTLTGGQVNDSVTRFTASSGNTALFTVTAGSVTTLSGITITPVAGANGTATLTVTAHDDVLGGTVQRTLSIRVRPALIFSNLSTNQLTFAEDTFSNITFRVDSCLPFAASDCTYTISEPYASYTPGCDVLASNRTTLAVSGGTTNLTTMFWPKPDAFYTNAALTARLDITVGTSPSYTFTTNITIRVTPVPDPPKVSNLPSEIFLSNRDPWTNVFHSAIITDVDDFPIPYVPVPPAVYTERLSVTVSNGMQAVIFNNTSAYTVDTPDTTNTLMQTVWLTNLTLRAKNDLFCPIGTTNEYGTVDIYLRGADNLLCLTSIPLRIWFKNTPPTFDLQTNPNSVTEGTQVKPFIIRNIVDIDPGQDEFTLSVSLTPEASRYGVLSYNAATGNSIDLGKGNETTLANRLVNLAFTAHEGIMTNHLETLEFIFELSDGYDSTIKTNTLSLVQLDRAPEITLGNGAPLTFSILSSDTVPLKAFPFATVSDPDEGGNQFVQIQSSQLTVTPKYLTLTNTVNFANLAALTELQHPTNLTALVRQIAFVPDLSPGSPLSSVPIGTVAQAVISITATDKRGRVSAPPRTVTVSIDRRNAAPVIIVPEDQPLLFSPGTVIRPFANIDLWNDDANDVKFTFVMDNAAKGDFGNIVAGLTKSGNGYTITASITNILAAVTNVTFTLNPSYPFPMDNPGGTRFTLTAQDHLLANCTRTLDILVQKPPRNWLVTRMQDDGAPGSFSHALNNFGNNDVITFALPEYDFPTVLRLTNAVDITASKRLTIKGPGADRLAISGDVNGDGKPDRRLLTVTAPVTIEGITITDCAGDFGGAISVMGNGHLTLRQVTIRNCVAYDAGGAIDVDGGQLTVESCIFMDNATHEDALYGGGAVSLFTDKLAIINNSLFVRNVQGCVNGDGGGAIIATFNGNYFLDVEVTHCTFVDNEDHTWDPDLRATSILGNNCAFYLENNIFADDPFIRTLNVVNRTDIWSFGGNICNNNTSVFLNQGGGNPNKILLDHSTDKREYDVLFDTNFAPTNVSAFTVHAAVRTDLAGRIRKVLSALPGAVDPTAAAFPAITEIQFTQSMGDPFIEIYAPYGSKGPVNLHDMTLLLNGKPVHTFGQGTIANPANSTLYTAGTAAAAKPLSYTFTQGRGVVIVFPRASSGIAAFHQNMAADNPTPVVRASIVTNAADFAALLSSTGRGSVSIVPSGGGEPVVHHTFLTAYNDPASSGGTNLLLTAHQSIATVPDACGFAFIPHERFNPRDESPGALSDGTPFGSDFPPPVARRDFAMTAEDDSVRINVLANDTDPLGDPIIITTTNALFSTLGATVTYDPATQTLIYNPTGTNVFQQLPAGRELIDTFTYTIWAGRKIPLGAFDTSAFGILWYNTPGDTHGLASGDVVWLDGVRVVVSEFAPGKVGFYTSDPAFASGTARLQSITAASTRDPDATDTATVTVTVEGLNDNPVGTDDLLITSLTESAAVRILAHTNLSTTATFNETPQTPLPNIGLLNNDTDVDEGDTPDTFRITGVLSDADVHPITAIASASGGIATRITSPAHGLTSGATVTIVGVKNPARLNGPRAVTVVDADTFDIPVAPGIIIPGRTVWIPSTTALTATTPLGASVSLIARANPFEDSVIYNAGVSDQLRKLAQGESIVDGFWYILVDKYNAPGIAYVSLTVRGENNPPIVQDVPPCVDDLLDRFGGTNVVAILTNRINVLTILTPSVSGTPGRADLIVADKGTTDLTTADLLLLSDFYVTDERTPLLIAAPDFLARATDIDTNNVLFVSAAAPSSMLGASLSKDMFGNIIYSPQNSPTLRALGIGETAFDMFTVYISDGLAATPMRAFVIVRGVNNKPTAAPVYVYNPTGAPSVTFTPNVSDPDVNDILTLVTPPSNTVAVPNPSQMTNAIPYTVTDHSLFLAVDDTFRIPTGAPVTTLNVLTNDVNFHATGITLLSVTPSLRGGAVSVNATRTALLYTPPAGFMGTDIFTYAVTNSLGITRKANVTVHVIQNEFNGPLHACDDEYAVAKGMSLNMPVTLNDVLLPNSPAGLTVDPAFNSTWPAGLTLNGNVFHYQSDGTETGVVSFQYLARGSGGSASVATVRIKIIKRETALQPDYFTAAPGAAPITLNVLANDIIHGDSTDGMLVTGVNTTGTHGTVAIAANGLSVTYAAPAGFIGVDTFAYTAVDRYGATGTTNVHVTVGVPIATKDSVTIATNDFIDVLLNDTVLPYAPPTSLTLTGVSLRSGENANGATATILNNKIYYTTGTVMNAAATWLYTYTVPNNPGLVVTGELHVITAPTEMLYANPDNFTVRMNSTSVALNVLANDISYRAIQYPLTVQGFQSITALGGAVTRDPSDSNILRYTPPAGIYGADTFDYVVSDGNPAGTRQGQVTLNIVRGDLIANNDAFFVGYEWDGIAGKAKEYALPVLANDGSPFPIHVTPNFGIGGNAPQHGSTLAVSPDSQAVLFRPGKYPGSNPGDSYIETFTYEVQDSAGRKQSATVTVTVLLRVTAIEMETQDDHFNVERNSVDNVLNVTANDLVEPKTPLPPSGIHVTASAQFGIATVSGLNLIYTPPAGFVGIDTATYTVTDGMGGSGTASVTIYVGALPTAPDTFNVLRNTTNTLDVVANDALTQSYLTSYRTALHRVFDITHGGDVTIVNGTIRYVPLLTWAGAYPYTESFKYELKDDTGHRLYTGQAFVTVYDPADSFATSTLYVINYGGIVPPGSPRDIWNTAYFGPDWQTDPNARGTANPSGDGLSNDIKYALGGNPLINDPTAARIRINLLSDGTANITYTRRNNDPNLIFRLMSCDDLAIGDWQLVTTDAYTFIAHPTDNQLIISTHNVQVPPTPKHRFFKIVVDM